MPRRARLVLPGYFHQLTQRGNYGQAIFYTDKEGEKYLEFIDQYCRQVDVAVCAYCLMPNHIHFIVKPTVSSPKQGRAGLGVSGGPPALRFIFS